VLGAASLGCSWGGQTTASHALAVGAGAVGAYGAAAGIANNFGKKKTSEASTGTADLENQLGHEGHELNEMSHAQSTVNKEKPLPATPKENEGHGGSSSQAESSKQAQEKAEKATAPKEEPKKEEPEGKGKEKAH
jgi:hypothetical protein